jgi:hypothetical protein
MLIHKLDLKFNKLDKVNGIILPMQDINQKV